MKPIKKIKSSGMWKPKGRVWYQKNSDSKLGEDEEITGDRKEVAIDKNAYLREDMEEYFLGPDPRKHPDYKRLKGK